MKCLHFGMTIGNVSESLNLITKLSLSNNDPISNIQHVN